MEQSKQDLLQKSSGDQHPKSQCYEEANRKRGYVVRVEEGEGGGICRVGCEREGDETSRDERRQGCVVAREGFVKVNVDVGAKEGVGVGIGVVCRDEWGMARIWKELWEPQVAEAIVVLEGLEEAARRRCKRLKVEVLEETQVSNSYGLSKENLDGAIKASCPHPGFVRDLCYHCGERINDGGDVAFPYIHRDLRLGTDEISRLRESDVRSVLGRKKLYLILDLDHTLLNSSRLDDISSEEEYLLSRTDSLQDISKGSLFLLDMMRMMTKLRPSVRNFLREASQIFEMYIYTMGERAYALEMAKLLDPGSLYFNSRVISRADCTERHQKGLDVVLGQESAVLILDDTKDVWRKHADNLILIERYHFFSSSCRQFQCQYESLSVLKSDESELDGALATVLKVLKRIHGQFFDPVSFRPLN
ncbi:hypothetical protein KSS87_015447 [Heliosperma pusillum]|nr:hypothetical protein KSS87_015447 [Heliosperma pusillum]